MARASGAWPRGRGPPVPGCRRHTVLAPHERAGRRPSWAPAGVRGHKDMIQHFSASTRQKTRPPSVRGKSAACAPPQAGGHRPCSFWRSKRVPGRGRSGRLGAARGSRRAAESDAVLLEGRRDGRIRPPYCSASAPRTAARVTACRPPWVGRRQRRTRRAAGI